MLPAAALRQTWQPVQHAVRPNCVLTVKIVPTIEWKVTDGTREELLDPRLLPLLQAIAETGSLAAAVVKCQVSYRSAWGVLRVYRGKFSSGFVAFGRGRGARLIPAGKKLLQAHALAVRRLKRVNHVLSMEVVANGALDVSA